MSRFRLWLRLLSAQFCKYLGYLISEIMIDTMRIAKRLKSTSLRLFGGDFKFSGVFVTNQRNHSLANLF